jgi:hypothetical protein
MCERANRTLASRARSMLFAAGVPKRFSGAGLGVRRVVYEPGALSPFEESWIAVRSSAWTGARCVSSRSLWLLAHVWVPDTSSRRKLDARADVGVFLGMAEDTKGWEFWVPETGEVNRVSRNAYFHEKQFLRDIDSPGSSTDVQQPTPDALGDPFPEDQCLTSDPLRAREYLELPLGHGRRTRPRHQERWPLLDPAGFTWWDEVPPSSSGGGPIILDEDDDDEEHASPSPTGPPGGAAGEGECAPPAATPAQPRRLGQEVAGTQG